MVGPYSCTVRRLWKYDSRTPSIPTQLGFSTSLFYRGESREGWAQRWGKALGVHVLETAIGLGPLQSSAPRGLSPQEPAASGSARTDPWDRQPIPRAGAEREGLAGFPGACPPAWCPIPFQNAPSPPGPACMVGAAVRTQGNTTAGSHLPSHLVLGALRSAPSPGLCGAGRGPGTASYQGELMGNAAVGWDLGTKAVRGEELVAVVVLDDLADGLQCHGVGAQLVWAHVVQGGGLRRDPCRAHTAPTSA